MTTLAVVANIRKNSRQTLRVAIEEFKGFRFVDVRTVQKFGDDDPMLTRRGVCLDISRLDELIDALVSAKMEARRRGLFDDSKPRRVA